MASSTPQWPSLLDPSFRAVYGDTVASTETVHDKIFEMNTTSRAYEKETAASGLSRMVVKGQGDAIKYEDPIPGYDVTYTPLSYALGRSITKEMFDDDQFGVMKRTARDLATSKIRTKEQFGADFFNYGFTAGGGGTAAFTGGDTLALFSNAHTSTGAGVGTQSNYSTADLDEDSLETALVTMGQTLDNKGQLQMIQPDTLLVPRALEKEAMILLNSGGRVGTANNDVNPYKGRLKLVVWDWLGTVMGGSDTAWFVLDSNSHFLKWFTREDQGVEGPEYDFDTKSAKWSIFARWSAGYSDWRGVYGSKGDNS